MADYVLTIDSDVEEDIAVKPKASEELNPDFTFDLTGDPYADLLDGDYGQGSADVVKSGTRPEPLSVDEIIARRQLSKKRKRDADDDDADEDEEEDDGDDDLDSQVSISEGEDASDEEEDDDEVDSEEDVEMGGEEDNESVSEGSDEEEDSKAEIARKAAFFDDTEGASSSQHTSFLTMNISRPLLKALSSMGFQQPTPIQAATIPVALLGKDVVGNAVTGSGKTAAFIIPIIERLLYRDKGKKAAATRCLVLTPTRELAVQSFEVGSKLAAHTDIRFSLIVGGLSIKAQEASLRQRPDVVIATPGRLIDHVRNSHSFTLDNLDILILDEADRMLEDGFADELTEIIKSCPTSRQTMLFSATMTDTVDDLVRMSLQKPVRLFVDPKRSVAKSLVQEFVRVRAGKEAERSALLVALCKRTFRQRTIVFLRSKKLAHQLRIVFSLLGMKCDELHGDLSQEQRLRALQQFKDGTVDFLMATDLASRGLDIKGIETVINYDMPSQLAQYLHRVGRTARAGQKGRSVTLVGEADRKMLKAAIKHGAGEDKVRHRIVPADAVAKWSAKLGSLNAEIAGVMDDEKQEKELRRAEMELRKGQNMIEHQAEIYSRPARTWFQTQKEKDAAGAIGRQQYESGFPEEPQKGKGKKAGEEEKDKPKRGKYDGMSRKAKRRKMAMDEDAEEGNERAINASIRGAKKAQRPDKIGVPEKRQTKPSKSKAKVKKARVTGGKVGFDQELGQRAHEGARAKKGVATSLKKKAPGKRK